MTNQKKDAELNESTKVNVKASALITSLVSAVVSIVIGTAFILGIYYKMDARISSLENDKLQQKKEIENLTSAINENNKKQAKLLNFLSAKFGVPLE